jgi:hypothetical protein
MPLVREAVYELTDLGVEVLSPSDPRIVDQYGEFVFVASDRLRSIELVQKRHLAAIEASDFLWLVDPEGYVGTSASLEIGFALAIGTPVFAPEVPIDLTIRRFVRVVPRVTDAIADVLSSRSNSVGKHVLLDPEGAIAGAHASLDELEGLLLGRSRDNVERAAPSVSAVQKLLNNA